MSQPDYDRIAELERELGLADPEPPPRPVRLIRAVCLTKNCEGDTIETRSWNGAVFAQWHTCRKPT